MLNLAGILTGNWAHYENRHRWSSSLWVSNMGIQPDGAVRTTSNLRMRRDSGGSLLRTEAQITSTLSVVDPWRDCGHAIGKRICLPDANGLCADLFPTWRFGWNTESRPSHSDSILEILEIPARTLSMGISATGSEGGSVPASLAARVRSPCQYPVPREARRNGIVL
jgi:hypothetical protein